MRIGVLALQGDFSEHQNILEQLGAQVVQVRMPAHLQRLDGTIVAARQGRWLATSFHPELTADDRFHRYFMEMAK